MIQGKCYQRIAKFLPHLSRQEKIILVSYPRCGNSMLRSLLERQTNIVTGSDSRPNRPLPASLVESGFVGEGVTTNAVWVIKSHYPERYGYVKVFADRAIVLVRNPVDAIYSYFNMGMTNSHDKTLTVTVKSSTRLSHLANIPLTVLMRS